MSSKKTPENRDKAGMPKTQEEIELAENSKPIEDSQAQSEFRETFASLFTENPELDFIYVTEDGNPFLPSNASFAEFHARKEEIRLFKITR